MFESSALDLQKANHYLAENETKQQKIMANEKDLTKLQHVYVDGPLLFYYEQAADGTRTLNHIRVNQPTFYVPADGSGITIDVVPPNAVGCCGLM